MSVGFDRFTGTARGLAPEFAHRIWSPLLEAGHLSLTEIAAELGFADLSSFSQAFKRWSGAAPSAR